MLICLSLRPAAPSSQKKKKNGTYSLRYLEYAERGYFPLFNAYTAIIPVTVAIKL